MIAYPYMISHLLSEDLRRNHPDSGGI